MKTTKVNKTDHTPNTKKGMGDFYGSGVKNPVMKPKSTMGVKPIKKMGKPPKSLA